MLRAWMIAVLLASAAQASLVTIGPAGINSAGLMDFTGTTLTGDGIGIGQVELDRPGDSEAGDDAAHRNSTIDPTAVFIRNGAPIANDAGTIQNHPEWIAGIMISTHASRTGVATGADLFSSAIDPMGPDFDAEASISAQHIATRNGGDIRAINMSFLNPLVSPHIRDGNQLLTQFVDWSASHHDVLYVIGGRNFDTAAGLSIPADTFNGMTVVASAQVGGIYRQVSTLNGFDEPVEGDRTTVSLMAPGQDVDVTGLGDIPSTQGGRSIAAPHVVGTVALLQEYADERIAAPAARWNGNARHHEVMKAVLMNSADKFIDNGTVIVNGSPVPQGGLLGMTRTVVKQDGVSTWLDSFAYDDSIDGFFGSTIPLDEQMGTGHLNASRALTQFRTGEFNADVDDMPLIGWDYGTTTGAADINRYQFASELLAGSFISITLAWDREVQFATDTAPFGQYNVGDVFEEYIDDGLSPPDDSVINDLDIYLLPKFAGNINQSVALSESAVGTVEHLFFQIPETGEYEFWVRQHDVDVGMTQDYAVAWWAAAPPTPVSLGDYNGDHIVNTTDYNIWKANFGTANAATDGNGNGIVDAADYTVWRDHLGQVVGSGSLASVPEPSGAILFVMAAVVVGMCRSKTRA